MALAGGRVQHGREEVGGALFGIFLRLCSLVCVDRGVRSRHGVCIVVKCVVVSMWRSRRN